MEYVVHPQYGLRIFGFHTLRLAVEGCETDRLNDMNPDAQTTEPKPKLLASTRYAILTLYRRLFTLVFLANVVVFVAVMVTKQNLLALVNATTANLLACDLARQPLVVNAIFLVVCSIPGSAPLPLRQAAAKVYHYGGVHSGCGVASLVWYVGFVGILSQQYWGTTLAGARIHLFRHASYTSVYHSAVSDNRGGTPLVPQKAARPFRTHPPFLRVVVALFFALLMFSAHVASQSLHKHLGSFLIPPPSLLVPCPNLPLHHPALALPPQGCGAG